MGVDQILFGASFSADVLVHPVLENYGVIALSRGWPVVCLLASASKQEAS